jgi:hypothetical protein
MRFILFVDPADAVQASSVSPLARGGLGAWLRNGFQYLLRSAHKPARPTPSAAANRPSRPARCSPN